MGLLIMVHATSGDTLQHVTLTGFLATVYITATPLVQGDCPIIPCSNPHQKSNQQWQYQQRGLLLHHQQRPPLFVTGRPSATVLISLVLITVEQARTHSGCGSGALETPPTHGSTLSCLCVRATHAISAGGHCGSHCTTPISDCKSGPVFEQK